MTLNTPPSSDLTVYLSTTKPSQPEYIEFHPASVVFPAGETVKSFNYIGAPGAVSGLIQLTLSTQYSNIYYMPEDQVNIEVLNEDTEPPRIVDTKVAELFQTSYKLRASCQESAYIYYMLTEAGTKMPNATEIMDANVRSTSVNKTNSIEIQGNVHAKITESTKTYKYFDSYIDLENLISNTGYKLYMVPVDLGGNIGPIKSQDFKTEPKPDPVIFSLKAGSAITPSSNLINALSLVTGKPAEYFTVTFTPNFSAIPNTETLVQEVIAAESMSYEIMINNIEGSNLSPMNLLRLIDDEKDTLFTEVSQLDNTQNIGITGREELYDDQELTYQPKVKQITTYQAKFDVSVKYTGTVYGVILQTSDTLNSTVEPSVQQIMRGFDAYNFQRSVSFASNTRIVVDSQRKYAIWPHAELEFSFLYHSTEYTAYFAAAREDASGANILMPDSNVKKVYIKTTREIFMVDPSFVPLAKSNLLSINIMLYWILGLIL